MVGDVLAKADGSAEVQFHVMNRCTPWVPTPPTLLSHGPFDGDVVAAHGRDDVGEVQVGVHDKGLARTLQVILDLRQADAKSTYILLRYARTLRMYKVHQYMIQAS